MVAVHIEPNRGESSVPAPGEVFRSFDELLSTHDDELYRYAMRLTRNRDDADDLYQDCLLKAYRAFSNLDGDVNYRAWLYKIMTNTFISDRRKDKRLQSLDDSGVIDVADRSVDQSARIDAKDLLIEVQCFVDQLPEKQRIALILRKYQDLDYSSIAGTLNSSEDAARANVYEAVRKLRRTFGERDEA